MKNGNIPFQLKAILFAFLLVAGGIYSASAAARAFGTGSPGTISALPPGELRTAIEALPATARSRALQWLQSIEFTTQDLSHMRVDPQGGIYYADSFVTSGKPAAVAAGKVSEKEVFHLHSFPGARYSVYIDFDGGVVDKTAWNVSTGVKELQAGPYDSDGKPDEFSAAELAAMKEIWQQVAEDFAPFKVDVTTEDPGPGSGNTGWILVTRSDGDSQSSLPHPKAGAVSYINTFGFSHTPYYAPVFVYTNNLGSATAVAGAVSHGMGHLLGLSHDGGATGKGSRVSWAPIMGLDPEENVTQWCMGGTNDQDDIAILTGRLGLRGDDHNDTRFDKGTPLAVDAKGRVKAASIGRRTQNAGVIEDKDDIDVFVFDAGPGTVELTVSPLWQVLGAQHRQGGNVDLQVALFDAKGKRITEQNPRQDTAATLKTRVPGGRYTLEVSGVANPANPDTDYGSLGQYFITGSVPVNHKAAMTASKQ